MGDRGPFESFDEEDESHWSEPQRPDFSDIPRIRPGTSEVIWPCPECQSLRIEHPTIYLKSPYALMLPKDLISKDHASPADYTRFDGTVILFNGFGKNTVVSFPNGRATRTIRIPNDQIIVE